MVSRARNRSGRLGPRWQVVVENEVQQQTDQFGRVVTEEILVEKVGAH